MTLIMPPGEEIMVSPKDGDADSGCFAESCEDGKDGGCNLKEGCLTPDLKRQQDVQDLSTPSPDLGPRHNSSSYGDDDPALFDPDDSDGSPCGTLDKTPPSGRSSANSLVIYKCNASITADPSTTSSSAWPCESPTPASPPASPRGSGATKLPPDCGGEDGATQEPAAVAAAPVLVPLSPTPTPHSHEGSSAPSDPLATKDITGDYTSEGKCAQNHNLSLALSKEILADPDARPLSLTVIDTNDSAEGIPVCSDDISEAISETRISRSSCEIISSDTNVTHLNNRTSDSNDRQVSVSEQSVKYNDDNDKLQNKNEVHNSNSNKTSPVENIELQAAKQKIVTMRQNFLFSLATSEVCDIQKPQVVKCVSVGSTELEDVSDKNQVPDILRAQEGGSDDVDDLLEVLGVQLGVWQHPATTITPSSDSHRKSSLENWTRELQARKVPPLTGVHHRENIARSEAGSRRASECLEGTEAAVGGLDINVATGPLRVGTCSVMPPRQDMSRGSCNLSGLRCEMLDEEGEEHLHRPRDDPGNISYATERLTSSLISHKDVVEISHCVIGQGVALRNSSRDNVRVAYQEHPQEQLVSSARDHEHGGGDSTCVGDITSQGPSRLTLTHQSPAVLPRARHNEHQDRIVVPQNNNHYLHTPILPDISSYSQELYQRPPPPQFSTLSGDTANPSHISITTPSADCSNKVSLLNPRDPQNKCGLVIALTGDTVGVDVRIVKNKDALLVKLQDERPRRSFESQNVKSKKLAENKTKSNECIERPYIKDLDRGKLSSYENYIESDENDSETSCVGLLNFDKNGASDSDVEYNIQRKRRLSEACKDIARAFDALPAPQEDNTLNSPLKIYKVPINFSEKKTRKHKDQEIEASHSDSSEVEKQIRKKRSRVQRLGTSTASKDDKRNSFYDNCCKEDSSCECRQCLTSADEEQTVMFKNPTHLMSEKTASDKKDINSRDTSDCDEDGFRTDVGDGCRTDEFDPVSSEDNDYDDDYCQTDDCGDDCDYCSGEDAEDEEDKADMTCYYCRNAPSLIAGCKHPGVITNGVLKSYGRYNRSGEKHRVVRQRPLILQAAIQRRRLSRRGLVAIRESSMTSDENISEEESYDGSNCDISSSWKFGLEHDISSSRSSTLKSEKSRCSTLKSEKSSSSAPMERARITAKEKSNSLPVDMTRSMSGVEAMLQHADSKLLRYPSTSEEESGSMSSLGPRLPPRPPRAPNSRTVPSPSPPSSLEFSHSPRPCMGLQGLQKRSPSTPKTLHSSGLPVVPRTQVAPRSPSNPNPPYGFPLVNGNALLCPSSPSLPGRSTPSPVEVLNTSTTEGGKKSSSSPRVSSRAGALVTRNFSISDDESSGKWTGGRRHVTITRHESVYKEVAEHGYVLPPGSPVDPYWLTWKLGVLQKTVEDVSGHLEEAEKTVATWGGIPQDSNLADQHAHNVRKFREGLADLQRGVDDVNDQAARFSAHNVPLTPNNSAKLHDLNNRWKTLETAVNDRWRQVAGKSREVATPLTPAQLASSVAPPWERATTTNKVPYYINHEQESTRWDHPLMLEMLDELTEFNHIKFSAYRTASKLRVLQKKLALDHANMLMATDLFDEHGLRGQNDRLIDVNDMMVVLSALYSNISAEHPEINIAVAMDLCLNWLLNVYDSQRTGQMRVLSFKIGLICLCQGHLDEKYRYMFRLIADPNHMVDQRKMGLLLHDCLQVPRQLGEVAAFGGSNIEPSVRSCFTKAGKDRETVEAMHFLSWVQQEPQSLVWLAVLHRVAASENIIHQVKCNICRTCPIVGLRYRCLKCLSFDMCQQCFFEGRSGKSHKVTHPMHEYCTATTAGEDMKDFTKALKNKFKSKRSLQKQTKKGYLPVQTVLEGEALESPSPSPQYNVSSQDMHSRLEAYASRLAEVEHRINSNSTPDSEDEHGLIAQYCQSLSSSDAPIPVPRSPLQIMAAVDAEQKDELEQMIRDLEDENQILKAEYDSLKSQQPNDFPPDDLSFERSETEMLAEAKLLRQHKGRLEARMGVLEEHNRQLEVQLHRLRKILEESRNLPSPAACGTLETKSVTASQLAMDSPTKIMDSPTKINGYSKLNQDNMNDQEQGSILHCPHEDGDEDNDEDDDDLGRKEITNF